MTGAELTYKHPLQQVHQREIITWAKILFCLLLRWEKSFKTASHTLPNSWSRDTESDGKSPITGALAGPQWAQICLDKDRCGTGKVIFNRAEWHQMRMIPGFSLFRFRFFCFWVFYHHIYFSVIIYFSGSCSVCAVILQTNTNKRHVLMVSWITSWWD